jgi:hypothetical protein
MMAECLKQLVPPILTILIGWFLGLFTPTIAERIRRPYRRRTLMRSVIDELLQLQHTMVAVAHRVRARWAEVTDSFLDEILPIVEGYSGPDRNVHYLKGLKEARAQSENERVVAYRNMRKPNVGIQLRQYSIPLLATQIADLSICDSQFQRSVLNIRYQLDLFNQVAHYAQSMSEKTFTNPTPEDREALIQNQEEAYRDACMRAEIIIRGISDLQKRYGARKPSK